MWTASQLVARACRDAHAPGFIEDGQLSLQQVLDDLCHTGDYAAARGVYYFNFNPQLVTNFGGFPNFSGPYPLPLDYLRTSGSHGSEGVQWSFFYVYQGQPFQLVPWDLGKFDQMVQQPSQQTFPYAYATDISTESTAQDRIAAVTTAATTIGSNQIALTIATGMPTGGGAILLDQSGAIVLDSSGAIVLTGGSMSGALLVGMAIAGLGIAAGSVINAASAGSSATTVNATLSLPATGTFPAASVMIGTAPVAYLYPGPSGAFPATLRYQRLMPPLQDFTRIPWFPMQGMLQKRLTARIMATTDDARMAEFDARADKELADFQVFSDDKTSRAQTVIMDRNNFGSPYRRLRITKDIGW